MNRDIPLRNFSISHGSPGFYINEQEVCDNIANYITTSHIQFTYMQYPKFLLLSDLNETCRELYMILLDRARLSQKNNWTDDKGHVYIIYPIRNLTKIMKKSQTTIKDSLKILETNGYIERVQQGFQKPNRIYVMIPEDALTVEIPADGQPEFRPSISRKTDRQGYGNPAPSKNNLVRTNKTYLINYDCEGDSL